MAAGAGKLRFTVHSTSGEDPDYPARELLFHSPQTRGWQSPRFCSYPQEVVLRLEEPAKLEQIQILSHEYKIPTKIEIHVGCLPPGTSDPEQCVMKRLGYLSFNSNERTGHQARELKSVRVNSDAYLLRLVVQRCHTNKLNIYNQVGIIALNLVGQVIQTENLPGVPSYVSNHYQPSHISAAAGAMADLSLDVNVDPITAGKIREINKHKEAAVAKEDYDEAKRLKLAIERLKAVGQKVAQLEARKRVAVEREDYDMAKALKQDIDKLRAAGEAAATGQIAEVPKSRRATDPEEIFNRVLGSRKASAASSGRASSGQLSEAPSNAAAMPPLRSQPSGGAAAMPSTTQEPDAASPPQAPPLQREDSNSDRTPAQAYDDRPARARGSYTGNDDDPPTLPDPVAAPRARPDQPPAPPKEHLPEGFPPDLPAPEPLPLADAKDAEALIDAVGEYTVRALYSKTWQLREAALMSIEKVLKGGGVQGHKGDLFKALSRALLRSVQDKVANVFQLTLQVLRALIEKYAAEAGGREVTSLVSDLLPILIDKAGDNNTRIRDSSTDTVLWLAHRQDVNMSGMLAAFTRPVKNQNAWRPVYGRLQLINSLVPLFGVSKGSEGGFQLEPLMKFVGSAFTSANAEVRSQAVKVTLLLYSKVGPSVQKFLPEDLNPKIKEQLDNEMGGPQGTGPPPGPPPAAASSSSAPAPAKKPAANASRKKSDADKAAQQHVHQAAAAQRGQHQATDHALAEHSQDDPRAYEAELAARERALGPDHPDVAESLTNIAILYNQRLEFAKAQPLYERALRIYEKARGPDHADVAHCLTDLAVLHLEQGRDDIGRPLLQRAYDIQNKALGPNHPDVLAIADVLNSEDD
ncbi:TPA: hypothetical protein ACH3X3_007335 [Trebouxia sp. C0006]